jgi:hypothetical protein
MRKLFIGMLLAFGSLVGFGVASAGSTITVPSGSILTVTASRWSNVCDSDWVGSVVNNGQMEQFDRINFVALHDPPPACPNTTGGILPNLGTFIPYSFANLTGPATLVIVLQDTTHHCRVTSQDGAATVTPSQIIIPDCGGGTLTLTYSIHR